MKSRIIFIITLFAITLVPVFSGEVITLDAARKIAISNSNALKSAASAMDKAQLEKAAVKYSWYPDISVNAGYESSAKASGSVSATDNTPSAGISLSQQIWDGGVTAVNRKITSALFDGTVYEWENTLLGVIRECDNLYYSYIEAMSQADSARASFHTAEILKASALARYESGIISKVSYLEVKSGAAIKETELIQTESAVKTAGRELASYLSLEKAPETGESSLSAFEGYLETVNLYRSANGDDIPENLLLTGIKNSPALKIKTLAVSQAELEKSLKIKEYNPVVNLTAGSTVSDISDTTRNTSISLSASFPISRWDRKNTLKQSDISITSAKTSEDEALREYTVETANAWVELVSSAQAVSSAGIALEYAEEYYNEINARFMLSAESISTLMDAEADKIDAQSSYTTAKFDFLKNISELIYLTGLESSNRLIDILKE